MAEFPDDYNDKLYEIVGAPFSGSPWWPALTYHPDEVPAQAKQMWLKKGEKRFEYYPVRFYKQLNFSVAKWTGLKSWHENFEKLQNGVVRGKKKAITAKVRADLALAIAEAKADLGLAKEYRMSHGHSPRTIPSRTQQPSTSPSTTPSPPKPKKVTASRNASKSVKPVPKRAVRRSSRQPVPSIEALYAAATNSPPRLAPRSPISPVSASDAGSATGSGLESASSVEEAVTALPASAKRKRAGSSAGTAKGRKRNGSAPPAKRGPANSSISASDSNAAETPVPEAEAAPDSAAEGQTQAPSAQASDVDTQTHAAAAVEATEPRVKGRGRAKRQDSSDDSQDEAPAPLERTSSGRLRRPTSRMRDAHKLIETSEDENTDVEVDAQVGSGNDIKDASSGQVVSAETGMRKGGRGGGGRRKVSDADDEFGAADAAAEAGDMDEDMLPDEEWEGKAKSGQARGRVQSKAGGKAKGAAKSSQPLKRKPNASKSTKSASSKSTASSLIAEAESSDDENDRNLTLNAARRMGASVLDHVQTHKEVLTNSTSSVESMLKSIGELAHVAMTTDILGKTAVGKAVQRLRKHENLALQSQAKQLVRQWKAIAGIRSSSGGSSTHHTNGTSARKPSTPSATTPNRTSSAASAGSGSTTPMAQPSIPAAAPASTSASATRQKVVVPSLPTSFQRRQAIMCLVAALVNSHHHVDDTGGKMETGSAATTISSDTVTELTSRAIEIESAINTLVQTTELNEVYRKRRAVAYHVGIGSMLAYIRPASDIVDSVGGTHNSDIDVSLLHSADSATLPNVVKRIITI